MSIRIVILILFLAILVSLAMALFNLLKGGRDNPKKTVNALTWRIALSVAVFIILMIAVAIGWLQPHGVY